MCHLNGLYPFFILPPSSSILLQGCVHACAEEELHVRDRFRLLRQLFQHDRQHWVSIRNTASGTPSAPQQWRSASVSWLIILMKRYSRSWLPRADSVEKRALISHP